MVGVGIGGMVMAGGRAGLRRRRRLLLGTPAGGAPGRVAAGARIPLGEGGGSGIVAGLWAVAWRLTVAGG